MVPPSQLTPASIAWITIHREFHGEICTLSSFIEKGMFQNNPSPYRLQKPISRWMRSVFTAFFEHFLGYSIIWRSSTCALLFPSLLAFQEAASVISGCRELDAARKTMADQAFFHSRRSGKFLNL
jgi:hypothetical protein